MTPTTHSTRGKRAFVLGFDGAPWGMLRRWVADGELPSFERLFGEGAAGPLRSTTPASTPLAWPSISTGVWPDQHGVYGFQRLRSSHRHRMYTSRDVRHPPLWELLSPAVVGNVPMTYPASELDGTMVTGLLTRDRTDGFTYPPDLADDLAERLPDYRVALDWSKYQSRKREFVAELNDLLAGRRELLRWLMERDDWRLFYFVFTAPDRLQHLVWEEDVLLDHYRQLDDILGDVLEYVEAMDATLFVVSDHGFGPVRKYANVNAMLADEGYLTPKSEGASRGLLNRVGLTRERVERALSAAGLDGRTLVDRLPRSLVDRVAATIPGDHGLYDVDYTRTTAFMHELGNVYVNDTERFDDGVVPPSDVDRVAQELGTFFEGVTDPETGDAVFDVYDGEEVFPRDDDAPDLVLEADEYVPRSALVDEPFSAADGIEADHRPEGVFLAWGPDVEPGSAPTDAQVVDVAPTVLHTLGEPVPAAADGRPLREIYREDAGPADSEVTVREYATREGTAVDGDFSEVEDRLRGLGYME